MADSGSVQEEQLEAKHEFVATESPLEQQIRRRILAGLAYYPMVVLLLIVLLSIRMTEWIGAALWGGTLVLFWGSLWICLTCYAPSQRKWQLPRTSLFLMSLIGYSYAILHDSASQQVRTQLQSWFRANADSDHQSAIWKPVVLQASIEEPLRYRKASIPTRRTTSETLDGWQTVTSVRISKRKRDQDWTELSFRASLVIDGKLSGIYPGDTVELYGYWRRPLEPSNPGQFDARGRYAELGLAAQLKVDSTELIRPIRTESVLRLDRWLAIWTEKALQAIDQYVAFDQAPLTAALVLGQREQADWSFQEAMLATGTIHMLSISGMHIEMVALSLLLFGWIFRFPRIPLFVGTIGVCVLYALLCGGNPPVARATIMLCAASMAKVFGWSFTSLNTLAFAGLILLTQRTSIAFEVGTQLSFLTVAVLILTFPLIRRRARPIERLIESRESLVEKGVRSFLGLIWESIRSSFWVIFISAPLVWHSFHILSPIAIALNLVLWLPMLIALLSGLGLVILFWFPPAAWFLGILCGTSLACLASVVSFAEKVPLGHFWSSAPPLWWLVGFYAIAFTISVWLGTRRASARRALLFGLGGWFILGFLLLPLEQCYRRILAYQGKSPFTATFIDVGHGTCVVMQTPEGSVWVYDAGRIGDHQRSYQPIVQALWSLRIQRIDHLILSHADSDHYNAMAGIIQCFPVGDFITTRDCLRSSQPSLVSLVGLIQERRIPIRLWESGDAIYSRSKSELLSVFPCQEPSADQHSRTSAEVSLVSGKPTFKLHGRSRASDNARSLCVVAEFADRRILLPGDLEEPGTSQLIEQAPIPIDVLMAPHHGSMTTRNDRLIDWCRPSTIVISGSYRSSEPRVIETYSPNHEQVFHTARDHAIRLEIEPNGSMHWFRWSDRHWERITKEHRAASPTR